MPYQSGDNRLPKRERLHLWRDYQTAMLDTIKMLLHKEIVVREINVQYMPHEGAES